MKSKIITITILTFIAIHAHSQPLPPTTPNGNPVPIGEFVWVLLIAAGLLSRLVNKSKQNKKLR